jgi:flagellar biosynthesis protein FliQ
MKRQNWFVAYSLKERLIGLTIALFQAVLLGGIFITPIIMISMLYVPYIMYFLLAIYLIGSLILRHATGIFLKVLTTYQEIPLPVKQRFQKVTSIILSILLYMVLAVIYLYYFH